MSNRWHVIASALAAIALRAPAVFNGLPYVSHPDEPTNFRVARNMVEHGSALPHFYRYPSLLFDLEAATRGLLVAAGRIFGFWSAAENVGLNTDPGPGSNRVEGPISWVVARLLILLISTAGVALVASLAYRLSSSRAIGFVGGALAATSGISIATGSVITPDALAGTLATAVVAAGVVLVARPPSTVAAAHRWALWSGVLLGLATAAKYNNALLAVLLAVAIGLAGRASLVGRRQVAWLAAASVATFILTTPGLLLDTSRFIDDLGYELRHYATGHAGAEGSAFSANLGFLWHSEVLAIPLALIGLVLYRKRAVLVLAAWPTIYLLAIGMNQVRFARNLTPVLGCVAVLAACGACELWARIPRDRRLIAAAVALVPFAIVHVAHNVADLRRELTDYRGAARHWLQAHVEPGSEVLADYYTPWLDRDRWEVTGVPFVVDDPDRDQYDVVIITSGGSGRFLEDPSRYSLEVRALASLQDRACRTDRYEDEFGTWIEVLTMSCGELAP